MKRGGYYHQASAAARAAVDAALGYGRQPTQERGAVRDAERIAKYWKQRGRGFDYEVKLVARFNDGSACYGIRSNARNGWPPRVKT